MLFIHAWWGYGTTSSIRGKGTDSFMNLMKKSNELQEISSTMNDYWTEREEIGKAAIAAFRIVYGGRPEDALTKVRFCTNFGFASFSVSSLSLK